MKKVIISILAVAACLSALYAFTSSNQSLRTYVEHPQYNDFSQWIMQHGKYYNSETELMLRFGVWMARDAEINFVNSQKLNYTFGHNQFSDLTPKEFEDQYLTTITASDAELEEGDATVEDELQGNIDWSGYMNPIKNQGSCGSCWAFSAIASLEFADAVKHGGQRQLFSEQEQVDCNHLCLGCSGGNPFIAFGYMKLYGATSEQCYPYTARKGSCKKSCPNVSGRLRSAVQVIPGESQLASAASRRVVSVAIHANPLQSYRGGIFDGACSGKTNHAVNVVGYGVENNVQFWKLRNSWGYSFGEAGYFRLRKGVGMFGKCSVGLMPSYPSF